MQNVMDVINGKENETTVMVNTTPQPLAWDSVMGCKSFTNLVTVSEAAEAVGANYEVKKHHMVSISDELYNAIINGDSANKVQKMHDMILELV